MLRLGERGAAPLCPHARYPLGPARPPSTYSPALCTSLGPRPTSQASPRRQHRVSPPRGACSRRAPPAPPGGGAHKPAPAPALRGNAPRGGHFRHRLSLQRRGSKFLRHPRSLTDTLTPEGQPRGLLASLYCALHNIMSGLPSRPSVAGGSRAEGCPRPRVRQRQPSPSPC